MNKFMVLSFQISWRRQGSLRATDDNGLVDSVGSQPSRAVSSSCVGSARSPQVPIIGSITSSGRPDWLRRLCPMFSALNGTSERCSEWVIFKSAQFLPRLKSWASLGTDRDLLGSGERLPGWELSDLCARIPKREIYSATCH
jgi:hypothetical protein